jgi:hypothetical protein
MGFDPTPTAAEAGEVEAHNAARLNSRLPPARRRRTGNVAGLGMRNLEFIGREMECVESV